MIIWSNCIHSMHKYILLEEDIRNIYRESRQKCNKNDWSVNVNGMNVLTFKVQLPDQKKEKKESSQINNSYLAMSRSRIGYAVVHLPSICIIRDHQCKGVRNQAWVIVIDRHVRIQVRGSCVSATHHFPFPHPTRQMNWGWSGRVWYWRWTAEGRRTESPFRTRVVSFQAGTRMMLDPSHPGRGEAVCHDSLTGPGSIATCSDV